MRLLVLLFLIFSLSSAFKERHPMKTKKYKCVELAEDEEIRIVKKSGAKTIKGSKTHSKEKSYEIENKSKARSSEAIELPQAHKYRGARPRTITDSTTTPAVLTTVMTPPPDYPKEVKRDSQGRPLILSPEHCQKVKFYANMYGVRDVIGWVKSNCRLAQSFVPGATCEDILTLVESCYRNKFL